MHRRSALQIGQREIAFAVAAVGRAEQRKKRGVLRQRQQLTVAPSPAFRRKIKRENSNFCNKWVCQYLSPLDRFLEYGDESLFVRQSDFNFINLIRAGENALQRDTNVDGQKRLHI